MNSNWLAIIGGVALAGAVMYSMFGKNKQKVRNMIKQIEEIEALLNNTTNKRDLARLQAKIGLLSTRMLGEVHKDIASLNRNVSDLAVLLARDPDQAKRQNEILDAIVKADAGPEIVRLLTLLVANTDTPAPVTGDAAEACVRKRSRKKTTSPTASRRTKSRL